MSNYFMGNFFAQKYFDPDEYFRLGVLVPVPVVPQPSFSGGGGSGVQPLWYIRELDCHKLDMESKDLFERVTSAWDKVQKTTHRDPLERKKTTKKEIEKIKNRDLAQIRLKIQQLRDKYNNLVKAGEGEETYVKKLKKRADELQECYDKINSRMERLDELQAEHKAKIEDLEKAKKKARQVQRKHAQEITGLEINDVKSDVTHIEHSQDIRDIKAAQDAFRNEIKSMQLATQRQTMADVSTVREQMTTSITAAVPWAVGSVAVFTGTYFLVPDDNKIAKFMGYTAGVALAGMAIWNAAPMIAGTLPVPVMWFPAI